MWSVYIYIPDIIEYYSNIKENEMWPFATTWMDLEDIMLSETRQRQIVYDFTYMWNLQNKWTNRNILLNTEKNVVAARGKGVRWWVKTGKEIRRHRLPVIKPPGMEMKSQHRERINNPGKSVFGDRQRPDSMCWVPRNLYKCRVATLSTWNEYSTLYQLTSIKNLKINK